MPISIQGNWTVSVLSKQLNSLPQRFTISGAAVGNGTYAGEASTPPVSVVGTQWQVTIQASNNYDPPFTWFDSSMRKTPTRTENGLYVFEIESEDLIQDASWNDLILRFTAPVPVAPPPPPPPVIPPVVVPPTPPPPPPPVPPPPPPAAPLPAGRVFIPIDLGDKLPTQREKITYGIWSGDIGNLTSFFLCSEAQVSSSYHRAVLNSSCSACDSEIQFDVAYGHDGGSGSQDLGGLDSLTPTNAIYGQYRLLCLDAGERRFKIGDRELQHVYIVNVRRARMGDRLDEGNVELNLAHLSGSGFIASGNPVNAHTGSNVRVKGNSQVLRLIDDSKVRFNELTTAAYSGAYSPMATERVHRTTSAGEVFYMVSGSLEEGIYSGSQPHVYGLMYPRLGIMVLDADKLDVSASFLTVTGSDVAGDNAAKLFTAISGAALFTDASGDRLGFQARRTEYHYAEYYFIRVNNADLNFTNNPTYQTGSEGQIVDDFMGTPKVYITTVGLYNEHKELLAVGKISRPIQKTYTSEALFTVKLKY
jgi:hypothetical protein